MVKIKMFSKIKSMMIKEFKQTLRDKRMILMLFGAPVIMVLVFGFAVNTDVTGIRIAVLDEDMSSQSRNFLNRFVSSRYFVIEENLTSASSADELLDRGRIDVFMHIKKNFGSQLKTGKVAQVQIILDGTDSSRASIIQAYVNQISNDFSFNFLNRKVRMLVQSRGGGNMRMKDTVKLNERILFNPSLVSRNFYLPGVIALIVGLITVMLTSMSVVKERETGTMEQIIVSPLKSYEFVAGKTLPFAIIGFADILAVSIIAIIGFGVPFNGNFLFLMICGLFFIMCMLAVGLYISTISHTQQQAMLSTFLFFIPSILFSGFIFPVFAMPRIFQLVTFLNPMRYFISINRNIFLKGVGISELWTDLSGLIILGSILLYLSVRKFTRRFE
ncbi:MAG: ABC transporter permease [Spirochaetes bacterium]|nr:ABC transporter permease [Spirochaetota bacterium]